MEDLFEPSRNCYRKEAADRAAFVVDGEAYFSAVREAFQRARHAIFIVGWDLHSDLRLERNGASSGDSVRLGPFLDRLVTRRKDLHVYLLSWDFAMIYAMEREFFPRYKLKWRTHKRIHFCLDGRHPVGASQHQKIVVVDDAVAFVGGFDLSKWRWDTPEHRPDDPRRIDPDGKAYPPFHDIQMAVDGPAARTLGQMARERWARAANGTAPVRAASVDHDPWPESLVPDFRGVQVAIARTLPEYGDQEGVREVERLYLDSIAAARRFIYVENQYFSSHRIRRALEDRLQEEDGPEVVIVLPEKTGGWLEQHTMDILRGRILSNLKEADTHGRLRTYYPRIAKDPHVALMVHSKVMVMDDEFVRVGSSNLSNRSMGLDSECDLAVAAGSDPEMRSTIARFRNRLIAEHLGCDIGKVDEAIARTGSMIGAIEALGGGERTLVPLPFGVPPDIDRWIPESELLDPEKPVEPDELVDYFVSPEQQPSAFRHLIKIIGIIAAVLLLAALWRWSPLKEWVDMDTLRAAAEWVRDQPMTPLLVPAVYIVGGMVAFPVTLLILVSVIVFGPWWGFLYALVGSELSALAVFVAGRMLGRDAVRRFAGSLLNRLSQKLSESGLVAVITFRIVPVAPFSVVNLIAGVSEIRLWDFALGTLVGMLPGVVAIVFLSERIASAIRVPDTGSFVALGGAVLLVGGGLLVLRTWIRRKRAQRSDEKSD